VDRMIDVFPADQQEQIRSMLAESLKGVVSQILLRKKGGKGRIAAQEIMVGTPAVSNLIRENKLHQIPSMIQTGKKDGMQLLDQHIMEHFMSGAVDAKEAYMKASNKALFRPHLQGEPPKDDFVYLMHERPAGPGGPTGRELQEACLANRSFSGGETVVPAEPATFAFLPEVCRIAPGRLPLPLPLLPLHSASRRSGASGAPNRARSAGPSA
jgi:hypothetical protein